MKKGGEKSEKMSKKLTAITSLAAYLWLVPSVVLAQEGEVNLGPPPGWNIPSNINLSVIVGGALQLLLLVAAVFFFEVIAKPLYRKQ